MKRTLMILTCFAAIATITGCSTTYETEPATTTMKSGNGSRHATCAQLRDKLRSLGYGNSDVVNMSDQRAANTIIAYKTNGCEK